MEGTIDGPQRRDVEKQLDVAIALPASVPHPLLSLSFPSSLPRYGNQAWTQALPWAGQEAFLAAEDTPWKLEDGTEAGMVRTAEGFTFLRVYGA